MYKYRLFHDKKILNEKREWCAANASVDVSCFIGIVYWFIIFGVQVKENIFDAKRNNGLCYEVFHFIAYNLNLDCNFISRKVV